MPLRDVLQPSFRGRLRLFFLVIVLLPLLAVGAVLTALLLSSGDAGTDGRLVGAERGVETLLAEQRGDAQRVVRRIGRDPVLAVAIQSRGGQRVRRRLRLLARRTGARQVRLQVDGLGTFTAGRGPSLAVARSRLASSEERDIGWLTVAVARAQPFARRVSDGLQVRAVVLGPEGVLASTLDADVAGVPMPDRGGVELDGEAYRVTTAHTPAFDGGELAVKLLLPETNEAAVATALVVVPVLAGFLALAAAFALIVSRALQAEVDPLLGAARRLGAGDLSARVPTAGSGEFATLGTAFNTMADQLEARLEELERERGRLQDAIRRVGESFARGLDRQGVLEIVVQTAVEGIGAEGGRATMRDQPDAALAEVARAGHPEGHARVLQAAEAAVLDAGAVSEVHLDGGNALAAPLGAAADGRGLTGMVSVARGDRPFTAGERELFSYLASQAGLSVENVDLHEMVQRQAVTDELTGLFNHRRFQEVIAAEVERARRFGHELGLVMLDIDNFKRVNDTYGHMQGDLVLREVSHVLRQSAREVDEPARYGGEEMAVALPQTDLEGAFHFAERVRLRIEALELPLLEGGGVLRVTASCGAASLATAPGADKESLVAAADAALYRAKRSGKNRTVRAE